MKREVVNDDELDEIVSGGATFDPPLDTVRRRGGALILTSSRGDGRLVIYGGMTDWTDFEWTREGA